MPAQVPLGVLIRFKNSSTTLPAVIAALKAQTCQPSVIIGIDTGSTDGSPELLEAAGARIISWSGAYHHSKVLNFGFSQCPSERVLVLSSHTVLHAPDAVYRLNAALDDPSVACASAKWDSDLYYSDSITWSELQSKGLRIGSIYSNSIGVVRRSFWESMPFDEQLPGMEDYAWAVEQVRLGRTCARIATPFGYQRAGSSRDFLFLALTYRIAARNDIHVQWVGQRATIRNLVLLAAATVLKRQNTPEMREEYRIQLARLWASIAWRFDFVIRRCQDV